MDLSSFVQVPDMIVSSSIYDCSEQIQHDGRNRSTERQTIEISKENVGSTSCSSNPEIRLVFLNHSQVAAYVEKKKDYNENMKIYHIGRDCDAEKRTVSEQNIDASGSSDPGIKVFFEPSQVVLNATQCKEGKDFSKNYLIQPSGSPAHDSEKQTIEISKKNVSVYPSNPGNELVVLHQNQTLTNIKEAEDCDIMRRSFENSKQNDSMPTIHGAKRRTVKIAKKSDSMPSSSNTEIKTAGTSRWAMSKEGSTELPTCRFCKKSFNVQYELNKHLKESHPKEDTSVYSEIMTRLNRSTKSMFQRCLYCEKEISHSSSLSRHIKRYHAEAFTASKATSSGSIVPRFIKNSHTITCPLCDLTTYRMQILCDHIKANHPDIQLSYQHEEFNNIEQFKTWKYKTERNSQCHFIKDGGDNTYRDGFAVSYYKCHRSGQIKAKEKRIRQLKWKGSNKIGKTCPAYMRVKRNSAGDCVKIKVEYQSVHIGHDLDVTRIALSKAERRKIAAELKKGVKKSELLEQIRTEHTDKERLGHVTCKDLHNICKEFKIDTKSGFPVGGDCQDDYESSELVQLDFNDNGDADDPVIRCENKIPSDLEVLKSEVLKELENLSKLIEDCQDFAVLEDIMNTFKFWKTKYFF